MVESTLHAVKSHGVCELEPITCMS
jgi:hypothetical protein